MWLIRGRKKVMIGRRKRFRTNCSSKWCNMSWEAVHFAMLLVNFNTFLFLFYFSGSIRWWGRDGKEHEHFWNIINRNSIKERFVWVHMRSCVYDLTKYRRKIETKKNPWNNTFLSNTRGYTSTTPSQLPAYYYKVLQLLELQWARYY